MKGLVVCFGLILCIMSIISVCYASGVCYTAYPGYVIVDDNGERIVWSPTKDNDNEQKQPDEKTTQIPKQSSTCYINDICNPGTVEPSSEQIMKSMDYICKRKQLNDRFTETFLCYNTSNLKDYSKPIVMSNNTIDSWFLFIIDLITIGVFYRVFFNLILDPFIAYLIVKNRDQSIDPDQNNQHIPPDPNDEYTNLVNDILTQQTEPQPSLSEKQSK